MDKKKRENILWLLGTIIALGMSYLFCRFLMFDFHGMRQWPTTLAIVTLAVLLLSLFLKKRWLSIGTILGYIGGFFVALLLNSDGTDAGGARSNNLWLIWAVVLPACTIVGISIEVIAKRKRLNK